MRARRGIPASPIRRLRSEDAYAHYIRMACERSLERLGVESFDLLLLHNPDRIGYSSPAVWAGMQAVRDAGLTRLLGVAPGPANGFTLDLIECMESFGALIDWAMIILSPLEPWPGELVLAAAERHEVSLITRVVDYGGLFHDDLDAAHVFARGDHRAFRPDGWVAEGLAKIAQMRPYAQHHGLTMLQLACQWNLAHRAVRCVCPTLTQERGPGARPVEEKRAELATLPHALLLSDQEVGELREIGDNAGCMALKGASPEHTGDALADRWALSGELDALAERWGIEPKRDLVRSAGVAGTA